MWGSRWETAERKAWALEAEAGIPPLSVITSVITGKEDGLLGSPQSRLLVTPFPRALSTLPRAQPGPAHLAPAPLPAPAAGGLLWHRGALGVGRGGHPHPSGSVSLLLTSSHILRATGKETKSPVEGGLGPWALCRPEIPPCLPLAAQRSGISETRVSRTGERLRAAPEAFWVRLGGRVLTEIRLAENRAGRFLPQPSSFQKEGSLYFGPHSSLLGQRIPLSKMPSASKHTLGQKWVSTLSPPGVPSILQPPMPPTPGPQTALQVLGQGRGQDFPGSDPAMPTVPWQGPLGSRGPASDVNVPLNPSHVPLGTPSAHATSRPHPIGSVVSHAHLAGLLGG